MLLNAWFDERTGDNVTNRAVGVGGGGGGGGGYSTGLNSKILHNTRLLRVNPFTTLKMRRELEPKCVPQMFLG